MMSNSAEFLWLGILINFRISFNTGATCYKRLLSQGRSPPWSTLFHVLLDKSSTFSFLAGNVTFQNAVLSFIEQNYSSIPPYLLKRFLILLDNCADSEIKQNSRNLKRLCENSESKRPLSSPLLPKSKHICLAASRRHHDEASSVAQYKRISEEAGVSSEIELSSSIKEKSNDEPSQNKHSQFQSYAESEHKSLQPGTKVLISEPIASIPQLLLLEDEKLISSLNSIVSQVSDPSSLDCRDIISVLNRISFDFNLTVFNKFLSYFVQPFLVEQKVCSRSITTLLSQCVALTKSSDIVFHILGHCHRQIIVGTAKLLVVANIHMLDDLLLKFTDFSHWSEDVTAFLITVIRDESNGSGVEAVVRYLTLHSDEKSSKTCTLVIKLLSAHHENSGILGLCRGFCDRNVSFLNKALAQKLGDFE